MAGLSSDIKNCHSSKLFFLSQEVYWLCCQQGITLRFSLMSLILVIMDSHCQPLLLPALKRTSLLQELLQTLTVTST